MSVRIEAVFRIQRKCVIPFITANFPSRDKFLDILHQLPDYGASMIEIGIPFSDPMADGPVIQATSFQAIQTGFSIKTLLADIQDFRQQHPHIPVILMTYTNPILQYGDTRFYREAEAAGVDGVLVVDRVSQGWSVPGSVADIRLIAPTTHPDRFHNIQDEASGFLYYVSVTGVTGTQTPDPVPIAEHLETLTPKRLPVVIGFGIQSVDLAVSMAALADGVVVGSSFLKPLLTDSGPAVVHQQLKYIQSIAAAIA